jgi:hypothetical protein
MPLLNMCTITGNNMVIQVGLAFLSGEKVSDYNWVLNCMRTLMVEHGISEPLSVVTDREFALINALDIQFSRTVHILCRWHVNMNVLAKTKKYFPGPVKVDGIYKRHPRFQEFLSSWNVLLSSITEEAYDSKLGDMRLKFPAAAMSYVENTWLYMKEKIVAFWVNQRLHFGITVTSPIEGCHAVLKSYLKRGNGDLRGVFQRLELYWTAQHASISSVIAQQQLRPRHTIRIPLFQAILPFVHHYALRKILQEMQKAPIQLNSIALEGCNCTITTSLGLPCFHQIIRRQTTGGALLLDDINHHWHYSRQNSAIFDTPYPLILNPAVVRGKGRPRGALGGVNPSRGGRAALSTQRNLSAFEIPSSSAPAQLQTPLLLPPTSTTIAVQRLENGHVDEYEPGTRRERVYQAGISSIYHHDHLDEATTTVARVVEYVYTQDAEGEEISQGEWGQLVEMYDHDSEDELAA